MRILNFIKKIYASGSLVLIFLGVFYSSCCAFSELDEDSLCAFKNCMSERYKPEDLEKLKEICDKHKVPEAQNLLATILLHNGKDSEIKIAAAWHIIAAKNKNLDSKDLIILLSQKPWEEFSRLSHKDQIRILAEKLREVKKESQASAQEDIKGEEIGEVLFCHEPVKIEDVAEYFIFLDYKKLGSCKGLVRQMKLPYFSEELSQGFFNLPLIANDPCLRGKHGPFYQKIWKKYKSKAGSSLKEWEKVEIPNPKKFNLQKFSPLIKKLLDFIYEEYGPLCGGNLSDITHKQGSPWYQTDPDEVISTDLIRLYCKQQKKDLIEKFRKILEKDLGEVEIEEDRVPKKEKRKKIKASDSIPQIKKKKR